MSYQVLARKWRPQNFEQMVGQQHVLRALVNALEEQRLHHAYLFTGTRGVGKTTIARILVKCLNCETGITAKPCGECGHCQAIAEGCFVDLIEVDAASRTRVEDTRELLDNIHYAPSHGRFKVYLIDEVHMLSGHSFNALLKTLEEPPEHVKFLLATTDPQKLPATILSRCLQFNLKRMPVDLIQEHLQYLLQQESITFEASALKPLARAADGSMRDALSLMDQAIAFSAGSLTEQDVRVMLGTVSQDWLLVLLQAIVAGDGKKLLDTVEDMAGQVADFEAVADNLISLLHQVAVLQAVPDSMAYDEQLQQLALHLSMEDVQLYYQIALNGRKDIPLSPDPRSGFEMLLLRMMVFRPMESTPIPISATTTAVDENTLSTNTHEVIKKKQVSQPNSIAQPQEQKIYEEQAQAYQRNVQDDDDVAQFMLDTPVTGTPITEAPLPFETDAHLIEPKSVKHINNNINDSDNSDNSDNSGVEVNTEEIGIVDSTNTVVNIPPNSLTDAITKESSVTITPPYVREPTAGKEWDWHQLVPQLGLQGMAKQFANHCLLDKIDSDHGVVFLLLDENVEQLHSATMEETLRASLETFLNKKVSLSFKIVKMTDETPAHRATRLLAEQQTNIEQIIANDPFVQTLQTKFGAQILPRSIKHKTE